MMMININNKPQLLGEGTRKGHQIYLLKSNMSMFNQIIGPLQSLHSFDCSQKTLKQMNRTVRHYNWKGRSQKGLEYDIYYDELSQECV